MDDGDTTSNDATSRAGAPWRLFRRAPIWAQVLAWLVFFWVLVFVWAASMSGRKRVAGIALGVVTLVGIGLTGDEAPKTRPVAAAGGERPTTSTTAAPATTSTTEATTTTVEVATTTTVPVAAVAAPAPAPTTSTTAKAKATVTTVRPATTTTTRRATTTTSPPTTTQNYVTPGAYCGSPGATGYSKNGVPMTCSTHSCTGEAYDKPRWRKTTC